MSKANKVKISEKVILFIAGLLAGILGFFGITRLLDNRRGTKPNGSSPDNGKKRITDSQSRLADDAKRLDNSINGIDQALGIIDRIKARGKKP